LQRKGRKGSSPSVGALGTPRTKMCDQKKTRTLGQEDQKRPIEKDAGKKVESVTANLFSHVRRPGSKDFGSRGRSEKKRRTVGIWKSGNLGTQ